MKYLLDYTKDGMDKLFKEYKVIIAFSKEQVQKGLEKYNLLDDTDLVSLGGGVLLPKENLKQFKIGYSEVVKQAVKQDILENGNEAILERELANHEIGYAYNGIHDGNFRDSIKDYNFTEEEIKNAYYKHLENSEY